MNRFLFLASVIISFLITVGLMAHGMRTENFDMIGVAVIIAMPLLFVCMILYLYRGGHESQQKVAGYFRAVTQKWRAVFFEEFPGSLAATYHDLSFVRHGRSVKATSVIRKSITEGKCNIFLRSTGVENGRTVRNIVAVLDRKTAGQALEIKPGNSIPVDLLATVIQRLETLLSGKVRNASRQTTMPPQETVLKDRLSDYYTVEANTVLSDELMMFLLQHPGLSVESTDQHLYVHKAGDFWALRSKSSTERYLEELLDATTSLAKLLNVECQ